jgi:transposase-like protein
MKNIMNNEKNNPQQITLTETTPWQHMINSINEHGLEGLPRAIEMLINEAMKIERTVALGAAPYERSENRRGYANGFKPKTLATRLGSMHFEVPKTRGIEFYPKSLEKGLRSERALKLAIAEMYVQGVSTRKVAAVMEELCGLEVSSSQVSQAAALLDEELTQWRQRPLPPMAHVVVDARYEKIRHGGSVISCAVLIAMGIRAHDGKRSILGVSVSLSEAEVHWRTFLASLQQRGLTGLVSITSDDHAGLQNALKALWPGVLWQRCQCHLQRNAAAYVPKVSLRAEVAEELRKVFHSSSLAVAQEQLRLLVQKYHKDAPQLACWLEENIPQGFSIFQLPSTHWQRLRTTNCLERLNRELRRRTLVATLFPNEASLLRLVSAVLMEVSEEWETAPETYLPVNN